MTTGSGVRRYRVTHRPTGFSRVITYADATIRAANAGDVDLQDRIRQRLYRFVLALRQSARLAMCRQYDEFLWGDIHVAPADEPDRSNVTQLPLSKEAPADDFPLLW